VLLRLVSDEPVATNYASDALQLAQTDDFDLYILSRRFPVDSGESLCRKLHAIAPRTPIIFLSAGGSGDRAANSRAILEAACRVLSAGRSATPQAPPH
jgi:DNA-binding response OmpR family regulator